MIEDFLSVLPRPVRVETPQTLLEVRIRAGKRIALRYLDREELLDETLTPVSYTHLTLPTTSRV